MAKAAGRRRRRSVYDWPQRAGWGWLVILGPMATYLALLVSLDLVGLSADREALFPAPFPAFAFRSGVELDLHSIAGRSEYAVTAAVYFLISLFAVLWAAPRILAKTKNPFGGAFGFLIAVGASLALYQLYLTSDFNLRIAFADDLLIRAETLGVIGPATMRPTVLGFEIFSESLRPSDMLMHIHSVVYFFGNAAPWFLIVFAATCASFEPGSFGQENHKSLRERMAMLQIAILLGAANIVLSVAYLRAMLAWPTGLLVEDLGEHFMVAATRYTAIWGAIGTLMLITVLAPAYLSLTRHFDRVATFERERDGDDYVSYQERVQWRAEHGLNLTSQEVLAAAFAVFAPLLAAPTLDQVENQPEPPPAEQSFQ